MNAWCTRLDRQSARSERKASQQGSPPSSPPSKRPRLTRPFTRSSNDYCWGPRGFIDMVVYSGCSGPPGPSPVENLLGKNCGLTAHSRGRSRFAVRKKRRSTLPFSYCTLMLSGTHLSDFLAASLRVFRKRNTFTTCFTTLSWANRLGTAHVELRALTWTPGDNVTVCLLENFRNKIHQTSPTDVSG